MDSDMHLIGGFALAVRQRSGIAGDEAIGTDHAKSRLACLKRDEQQALALHTHFTCNMTNPFDKLKYRKMKTKMTDG